MAEKKENFLKKAFKDMAESAKAQHKVDKANFEAVKAESKVNFEQNRGTHTFRRAKEQARASWEDAKLSPSERQAKIRAEQQKQIENANARKQQADEKLEELKSKRCKKD